MYDRRREKQIKRHDGQLPLGAKAVVYLIFPGDGVLASHLMALKYLVSKGYAPLVVSNLPLGSKDLELLAPHCFRVIERPNFGYDFGGYRDGVLELSGHLDRLERLVFLNDSCWFPLPRSKDWIDMAEGLDVDFVGSAVGMGEYSDDELSLEGFVWGVDPTRKGFHYGSYALLLRPAVFRHPDFLSFWVNLRLSNVKKRTIRRGEVAFSKWVLDTGCSHGATLDVTGLDQDISNISDAELLRLAARLIFAWRSNIRLMRESCLKEGASRRQLEDFVLAAVAEQSPTYCLAPYSIPVLGHSFLKKPPPYLDETASDTTLDIIRGLSGPDAEAILQEALELRRVRAPGFGDAAQPLPSAIAEDASAARRDVA